MKILEFIKNPSLLLRAIMSRMPNQWLSDEYFLGIYYYTYFNQKLDFNNPQTYNQKLQWMKVNDRNPKYIQLVDKYLVREFISHKLGEEYLIPLVGVWANYDDIYFKNLPDSFVLKTTHDSGGVVICKNKSMFDFHQAKKIITKSLSTNYFQMYREWPYKFLEPRIIVEEYLEDSDGELKDYKFFCFNGEVHSVMVCAERDTKEPKFYFFDEDWSLLKINKQGKKVPKNFTIPKPKNIDKMFEVARVLSENIPHVRVDLYNIDGAIYFGEMTFYSESGFDTNLTPKIDKEWGKLINII